MAIQTALFSKVMADRPLDEVAELAAEIGYDGIEPMGRDPHLGHDWSMEEVDDLADHLADLGLDVPCLGSYTGNYVGKSTAECEAELEKLETHLEYAQRLDCDIVRHGPGGPPVRDATDEQYDRPGRRLRDDAGHRDSRPHARRDCRRHPASPPGHRP
jgi:sugar phosphate isomerase/epimerase